MPPKQHERCTCDWLQNAADEPKWPIEFDEKLNEFHLVVGPGDYLLIYYCPLCGGKAPESKRKLLFQRITDAERKRLVELTENLKTVQDVTNAFGEPDLKHATGLVATNPERDGKPETMQGYPVMIYEKISDIADVHVTIYPLERVALSFQGKPANYRR